MSIETLMDHLIHLQFGHVTELVQQIARTDLKSEIKGGNFQDTKIERIYTPYN